MNTYNPLVSIITGYYNRENFVDESIRSLINQTYQHTEIIIFDDCSTDNTYNNLKKIAATDKRIRLIRHSKNKGFVQGLIDAIDICNGDYVAIHGSGDFSYPTRIKKQVDILKNNKKTGVVGCFVKNVEIKNGEERLAHVMDEVIQESTVEQLKKGNIFSHGEVMFRKTIYEKAGGYRTFFTYAQDYDLWARMSIHCNFYNIKEVLYKRYIRSDGATVVPEKRLYQALMTVIIRKNLDLIIEQKPDLIDQYNGNVLENIEHFSDQSVRLLYSRCLDVFEDKGKNSGLANQIVPLLQRSDKFVLPMLMKTIFFMLPTKFSLFFLQKLKGRKLLRYSFKLP